jgi:hypothetical protein
VNFDDLSNHLSATGFHYLLAIFRRPQTEGRDGAAASFADAAVALKRTKKQLLLSIITVEDALHYRHPHINVLSFFMIDINVF